MQDFASPDTGNLPRSASQKVDLVLPVVTAAIFTAATLLFWVQPMFGKMVLPLLGGTPAVWTTALLFFQTALLAGYLYAHAIGTRLKLRAQIAVHVAVLAGATLWLPVAIPGGTIPPSGQMPAYWLIGLFAFTVGIPYTAIAATSPLLQRWFALSGHAAASNPYQLYVASNAGSLLGLLGYPLIIEPFAGVALQSTLWSASFFLFIALIAMSGIALRRTSNAATTLKTEITAVAHAKPSTFERFRWVALAFVPSSLLLGVTTHITTDIAAMPLLWAAPLALYLITFIFAFAQRQVIARPLLFKAEALALVMLAAMMWFDGSNLVGLGVHMIAFFVIALARHTELSRTKPDAEHLTEFYLWMSLGGALGGVFNAVIAPELFTGILEYPITLVAAGFTRMLLLPPGERLRFNRLDLALPLAAVIGALVLRLFEVNATDIPTFVMVAVLSPLCLLVYHYQDRAVRFAFGLAAMFVLLHARHDANILTEARSFFGAYRVFTTAGHEHLILSHGTTIHGAQATSPSLRREPLTYYAGEGPLGQAINALQSEHPSLRFGVIGVGAGATVCYSRPSDLWTLFEIDPLVVKLAKDHGAFTFLKDCAPNARIVIGDARLSLANEANGSFDVLVLDAFSSDSIPTHLMTREAMSLLRSKLSPGGMIIFNISNRYLKLEPIVAQTSRAAGLTGISQIFKTNAAQAKRLISSSHWIALSPDPNALTRLSQTGHWHPLIPDQKSALWTDDYSNLLGVIEIK